MKSPEQRIVYVVMGWPKRLTNDRVAKVLQLGPRLGRMLLVVRGRHTEDGNTLVIRAIPNPFSLLGRLGFERVRRAFERLLFFPNAHVLFTVVAKRKLARRVRRDLEAGFDVTVMTSVPNHENTSVGLYLKARFPEIRWVMDWQDLWSYDDNYYLRVPRLYRGWLKARERKVLALADLNVTTNDYAARVLRQEYGVAADRVRAIHHHFDRRELRPRTQPVPRVVPPGPIRIGFLGSLFKPPRVPGAEVLQVLRGIRAAGRDVELHVHGRIPQRWLEDEDLRSACGLVPEPRVPHKDCVAVLSRYDYLLLLLADLPNSKAVMSIKLPQYLLVGKPILAIVPRDSAVAEIVERTRTGRVLPSDADWQSELQKILALPLSATALHADREAIDRFSWTHLSGEWLEALTGGEPPGAAPDVRPAAGDAAGAWQVDGVGSARSI